MPLATYDPSKVLILLADIIAVEDVMEGSFVQITKDLPVFTSAVSTDGKMYRKRSSSTSYTVSLTLSSTSKTNKVLQYMLIADQLTTVAKFPILIKDTGGSSLFSASTCWIENQPDLTFSDQVVPRVWQIRATEAVISYGDNYGSSSSAEDIGNLVIGSLPSLAGLLR